MNEFINMVLHELRQGILRGLGAAIVVGAGIVWAYGRKRPFPWRKAILTLLFVGYLAVLDYATLSRLGGMGASGVNFHLFRAWREAWNHFSITGWANVLLNIGLLVPFGLLAPSLFPRCKRWRVMLLASLGGTLCIETTQYLTGSGIFDVDDLFGNTLGAMMGYGLRMLVWAAVSGQGLPKILGYGLLAGLPLLAIAGIFIAYDAQEYGNLPDAYTYRIDTSKTKWAPDCQLSGGEQVVDIYRMELPADWDALRDHFEQVLNEDFERTDSHDESILYMNQRSNGPCAHFLTVHRMDGSYELSWVYEKEPTPAKADRETIQRLLLKYGVSVPKAAEFSYLHSGIHLFTVEHVIEGDALLDGTISCVYNQDGSLSKIRNNLMRCTLHGQTRILSQQAAYEKLRRGEFADATGILEHAAAITVTACVLEYQPDTKGFLQPVFRFQLLAQEPCSVVIPAVTHPPNPRRVGVLFGKFRC